MTGERAETRRSGACELCGEQGRELRVLTVGDFMGRACEACRRQLKDSQPRIWCGTCEATEPGE